MKISFVIPAYNEENYIPLCLDAIKREIASGSWDAEIIVANNASTDRTGQVASSFQGVKVVDEPRKGMVRARSAGYAASSGDLIANVDADTIMPAGWLAKVMDEFGRDPELLALSGPYIYYDASWDARLLVRIFYYIGFASDQINKMIFGTGSMLQGGNFVLRRRALEQIGGFDTSIEFWGEDADIARRVGKIGRVKYTFKLPMYSSGRRWQKDGLLATGIHYVLNFIWISFFGKPYESAYEDIRFPEKPSPSGLSKTLQGIGGLELVSKPFSERKISDFEPRLPSPGTGGQGGEEELRRNSAAISRSSDSAPAESRDFRAGKGGLKHALGIWETFKKSVLVAAGAAGAAVAGAILGLVGFGLIRVYPLSRASVAHEQAILTTNIKEGYDLLKLTVDPDSLSKNGSPHQKAPPGKLHIGP